MVFATTAQLRVLVVDDSESYLEAVSRLLATYSCVGKIDRAHSSAEALSSVMTDPPDLMLVDVAMPGMNGLDLTHAVKALAHPPGVIITTLYDTTIYRQVAMSAGADGFVGKSELGERLQNTIKQLFPDLR